MADNYLVTIKPSMDSAENTSSIPDDLKNVCIVVKVNSHTVRNPKTREEKKLWQVPSPKIMLTRRAYLENPNILFALLNKVLPRDRWTRLEWTAGSIDRVSSLVWPIPVSVEYEVAKKQLQDITDYILQITPEKKPFGPSFVKKDQTFWIHQHTKRNTDDVKKVDIVVNVKSKAVRDSETVKNTKLTMSLTRREYQKDPDILFTRLNEALPREKWAKLQWATGEVRCALPQLFPPYYISVQGENTKNELRDVTRSLLYLDNDDISMGPVPEIMQVFWIDERTDP